MPHTLVHIGIDSKKGMLIYEEERIIDEWKSTALASKPRIGTSFIILDNNKRRKVWVSSSLILGLYKWRFLNKGIKKCLNDAKYR